MSNIKKNTAYSVILTTANYIFPLIVYPYISRVLGVTNIGICNFVDSIINYFTLFAMMGINTIAIREIACCKNDKVGLSKTFSSLFLLNLVTTVIMIGVLIASIYLVSEFNEHKNLMYIGASKLLFNALLIEWLYKGLEKFKYITIRTILVRCAYVVSVFLLVRKADDYPIYYALLSSTIIINGIINFCHSRNLVCFTFNDITFRPYMKGFITLGVYSLLTSMYTTFNVVYLGFIGGNEQVGYYTTATKLHHIVLALFTAFTGVMLPRMTSLIFEGKNEDFKKYFRKSIQILFAFSIPLICLCTVFADQIIWWVAGTGYEQAVPCMQIMMPLVFLIGYEQILVIQILSPMKQDESILYNSIVGAIVGFLANLILVPCLASIGSSMVWVLSETVVFLSAQYFVTKSVGFKFPYKMLLQYIFAYTPLILLLLILLKWNPLETFSVVLASAITFLYVIMIEFYLLKNAMLLEMRKRISK